MYRESSLFSTDQNHTETAPPEPEAGIPDDISLEDISALETALVNQNPRLSALLQILVKDREQLRQQTETLLREQADYQATIRDLIKKVRKLSHDSITGLEVRTLFYEKLNPLILEHFTPLLGNQAALWRTENFASFAEAIEKISETETAQVPLSILMGDIAYLALSNEASHAEGDRLLEKIGQASREAMEQHPELALYKHGGDELAGVIIADAPQAISTATNLKQGVESQQSAYFEARGLDPHLGIDLGISHFSEGVTAFQKFLRLVEEYNQEAPDTKSFFLAPEERLRAFVDLWVLLADTESLLNKADIRIKMLKKYREERPEVYQDIVDSIRKGALGASDEDITQLDDDEEAIRQFIVDRSRKKRFRKREHNGDVVRVLEKDWRSTLREELFNVVVDHSLSEAFIQRTRPDLQGTV